jgi:hypothetical protein
MSKMQRQLSFVAMATLIATLGLETGVPAQSRQNSPGVQFNQYGARIMPVNNDNNGVEKLDLQPDGRIVVAGQAFNNWTEYFNSDLFRQGRHCTTEGLPGDEGGIASGSASDCSLSNTNPSANFAISGNPRYRIPVVVHVIRDNSGTQGNLSAALVQSQIDVLNEDYLATAGTPGANGTNSEVRFYLATTDPNGQPTTGITFDNNSTWFNDSSSSASYHNSLAWNPLKYLNIYSLNLGNGLLGFASIPQQTAIGSATDGVHILWSAFGRPAIGGAPYNTGRTATHEVGHYVGLLHTFQGGCGTSTSPGCYTTGDLICDTNPDSANHFGCPTGSTSCGFIVPIQNYMEYTDDTCMTGFTQEQIRRIRCTLENWRTQVWEIFNPTPVNDNCASATLAPVGTTAFSTLFSTTDGPDEPALCNVGGFTQISNDVWYKWVSTCTGTATFSLCGASYNTKMAIYVGCPGTTNSALACNDNFCGSSSQITMNVNQSTLYRVRIGGFNGSTGTGNLVISCSASATGACCLNGTCTGSMTQANCIAQAGAVYQGNGSTCGSVVCPQPCPSDVNHSGAVNIDDLLSVINAWGVCPGCAADINHSGAVDIDDLLAVINAWGACP